MTIEDDWLVFTGPEACEIVKMSKFRDEYTHDSMRSWCQAQGIGAMDYQYIGLDDSYLIRRPIANCTPELLAMVDTTPEFSPF